MLKKIAAAVAAATIATAAYANCRYFTMTVNGKTYQCSECCYGSGTTRYCNTTCN